MAIKTTGNSPFIIVYYITIINELGKKVTFSMLLSGSWHAIAQIESSLASKGAGLDRLIVMQRTTANSRPRMPISLLLQIEVKDSARIIACFSARFDTNQSAIAELTSKMLLNDSGLDTKLSIQILIHPASTTNLAVTKQHFHLLCANLNTQDTINVLTYPQHE